MIENNGASMSTNFILNEPLMVKDRLQDAYKKIIFISDNDFAQDQNYKKANQVLYARIKKLEEKQDTHRARVVSDVIPNSNLAKYGQYEYNESRERSYTSGVNDVSLHYPCLYKADSIKEPWMLPEVEQIFVHTAFAGTFNFILYEAELEQLDKIDLLEEAMPGNRAPTCCTGDFHKVNPLMDQMFDRAPGKTFGKWHDLDIVANMPYYFNVKEYDDVLLRNKIFSDIVRELWKKPKPENVEKLFKIYKTSLDNIFIEENDYKCANNLKSIDTEKSLQQLVNSILDLSDRVPKEDTLKKGEEEAYHEAAQPVRRLYSDVVQGNKSPANKLQQQEVAAPTKLTSKETIAQNNLVFHSLEKTTPLLSPPQETISDNGDEAKSAEASTTDDGLKTPKYTYSDALNNAAPLSNGNLLLNDFSIYSNNFRSTSSNANFQNFYNPVQYIPNTVYNANYRLSYANAQFSGSTCNQTMNSRQNVNSVQHSWFFPSYRPPNLCTYGNFLGQLLVPQMPTKHRWSNTHYGRPQTPQNVYQPLNQNWSVQNVYRSNSMQQMQYQQVYDSQKTKTKRLSTPTANPAKFSRSKTPDPVTSKAKTTFPIKKAPQFPGKILMKPNSDFKLVTRQNSVKLVGNERTFDVERSIPVVCSASDELEKIALREYQSSNDTFFTEIERQAKEQYDGNPENSCCPPNKLGLGLGGHATLIAIIVCIVDTDLYYISACQILF